MTQTLSPLAPLWTRQGSNLIKHEAGCIVYRYVTMQVGAYAAYAYGVRLSWEEKGQGGFATEQAAIAYAERFEPNMVHA